MYCCGFLRRSVRAGLRSESADNQRAQGYNKERTEVLDLDFSNRRSVNDCTVLDLNVYRWRDDGGMTALHYLALGRRATTYQVLAALPCRDVISNVTFLSHKKCVRLPGCAAHVSRSRPWMCDTLFPVQQPFNMHLIRTNVMLSYNVIFTWTLHKERPAAAVYPDAFK